MQLGILTAPFPDTSLREMADWAAGAGFEVLEIACWPKATAHARRYAGTTPIDVEQATPDALREIADELKGKGLGISALGYYPNLLHPDAEHRDQVIAHLKKVITAASHKGLPVVNTFCDGDVSKTLDENWDWALAIWRDIIAHARDCGVKIAFENCPMIFSHDEWPGGHNIAYSPTAWRRILAAWGDDVGMNYDPSHLQSQMIDQPRFVRGFGAHMLHVHAKDLMIDADGLYERGTLSSGMGWQVPRLPGLGDVDWSGYFSSLYRAGYNGPVEAGDALGHHYRSLDCTAAAQVRFCRGG